MARRIGIVVDSSCDLSDDFLRDHDISVLPIGVLVDGVEVIDDLNPASTLSFHARQRQDRTRVDPVDLTLEEMKSFLVRELAPRCDDVFIITASKARPGIHNTALRAASDLLRDQPGRGSLSENPIRFIVIDTQNFNCGQGVVAILIRGLIGEGADADTIEANLSTIVPHVYTYLIPSHPGPVGDTARSLVSRVRSALSSALSIRPIIRAHRNGTEEVAKIQHFSDAAQKSFNFLSDRIKAGLGLPIVCISYAGDLREMERLPGFWEAREYARQRQVIFHTSVMSMTGATALGPGSLSMAFSSLPHQFR